MIGCSRLPEPEPASFVCPAPAEERRRLRAPSGPIRRKPAPAGKAAIGRTSVTKRDKGRRGKEKRRKRWGCGERKKAQTAVTDRLGERSGGSSCPETGGAPAVPRSARTSDEGEDRLTLGSSAWRLAAGEGSGACCHLAGRTLFSSIQSLRVPPHKPLHLAAFARPNPCVQPSDTTKVAMPTCMIVPVQTRCPSPPPATPCGFLNLGHFLGSHFGPTLLPTEGLLNPE